MSNFTSDETFQLTEIAAMPRGMTLAEAEHYLMTDELPLDDPFRDISHTLTPEERQAQDDEANAHEEFDEDGLSDAEAEAFLSGESSIIAAIVAAGFHDDQLRDSHGRWTDSPDFPLSKQRADRMWQQVMDVKPLTPPQRQAVADYTGFAYEPINEFLRDPKNVHAEPKDLTIAQRLLDALRPTLHPMTVLRGTTVEQLGIKGGATMNNDQTFAALQKKIGKTFIERGFMSTTTTPSALEELEHSIILEIDVPPRSLHINAESMTVSPGENEVILAPSKYEVVSVRRPTSQDSQDVDLTYTSAIVRVRLVK